MATAFARSKIWRPNVAALEFQFVNGDKDRLRPYIARKYQLDVANKQMRR